VRVRARVRASSCMSMCVYDRECVYVACVSPVYVIVCVCGLGCARVCLWLKQVISLVFLFLCMLSLNACTAGLACATVTKVYVQINKLN